MRRSTLRAGFVAWAMLAGFGSRGALAAPDAPSADAPDARAYFNAGARAYAAGKYPAAIRAFEEAYRIEPRPGLVFSVAQAYRRQYFIDKARENLVAAIEHYRKYLELDPDGARRGDSAEALSELEPFSSQLPPGSASAAPAPKPVTQLMISSPVDDVTIALDGRPAGTLPYIAAVTAGVHHVSLSARGYVDYQRDVRVLDGSVVPLDVALEEKPARVSVVSPEGARIAVDGRFRGVSPSAPLELTPGRHVVVVTANGHEPFSREIAVQRDEVRTLDVTLPATVQRSTAWTLVTIGGAAILTGAGLMTAAIVREKRAEDMTIATADDIRAYDRSIDVRDELRLAGIITAGSGLAVSAIGLFLFAFDEPRAVAPTWSEGEPVPARRPREQSPGLDVSAVPWFAPGNAGVAVHGVF